MEGQASASIPWWRENLLFILFEWLALRLSLVFYGIGVPRGDGAPVVLIPGYLTNDWSLLEMFHWLRRMGYRPYVSHIGWNCDCFDVLVDRLLEPHRHPHIVSDLNIHEVLERVRSVVLAEFPTGLDIVRDYDASLPDLRGDMEQLIQAVLNIVHNAAQALAERIARGDAQIVLRTRVARQVTIAKRLFKLALDLHVIDNGPGIPEDIRERIFYPLVSGRDGGSGLGLTLAQTFVQQHEGLIECESRPGCTDFRILLPLH